MRITGLMPLPKARDSFELECKALIQKFDDLDEGRAERLRTISIHPYETIGAPRIGMDDNATMYRSMLALEMGEEVQAVLIAEFGDRVVELTNYPFLEIQIPDIPLSYEVSFLHADKIVDRSSILFLDYLNDNMHVLANPQELIDAIQPVYQNLADWLLFWTKNGHPIGAFSYNE